MSKFKIGDKIICNQDWKWGKKGIICEVENINISRDGGATKAKVVDDKGSFKYCKGTYWLIDEQYYDLLIEVEKEEEVAIGDVVEGVKTMKGCRGVVRYVDKVDGLLGVDWFKGTDNYRGHRLEMRCDDKFKDIMPDYTGYFVGKDKVKKVKEAQTSITINGVEYCVGDRIEVVKDVDWLKLGTRGTICKVHITDVYCFLGIKVDKKYSNSCCGHNLDSILEDTATNGWWLIGDKDCLKIKIIDHIKPKQEEVKIEIESTAVLPQPPTKKYSESEQVIIDKIRALFSI